MENLKLKQSTNLNLRQYSKQVEPKIANKNYQQYINRNMNSNRKSQINSISGEFGEHDQDIISSQMNVSIQKPQIMENENVRRRCDVFSAPEQIVATQNEESESELEVDEPERYSASVMRLSGGLRSQMLDRTTLGSAENAFAQLQLKNLPASNSKSMEKSVNSQNMSVQISSISMGQDKIQKRHSKTKPRKSESRWTGKSTPTSKRSYRNGSNSNRKNEQVIDLTNLSGANYDKSKVHGSYVPHVTSISQTNQSISDKMHQHKISTQQMKINNPFNKSKQGNSMMGSGLIAGSSLGFSQILNGGQVTISRQLSPQGGVQKLLGTQNIAQARPFGGTISNMGRVAPMTNGSQTIGDYQAAATTTLSRFSGQASGLGGALIQGIGGPLQTETNPQVLQFQNTQAQQSTALSTLRGTMLGKDPRGPQKRGKIFPIVHQPITQNRQAMTKPPQIISQQNQMHQQNSLLQNIQRIIQNNITENDIERKERKKSLQLDLKEVQKLKQLADAKIKKSGAQAPQNTETEENLDTVRTIQIQQQPTERLQCHFDKQYEQQASIQSKPQNQHQIKQTLKFLQSKSPFKDMDSFEDGHDKQEMGQNKSKQHLKDLPPVESQEQLKNKESLSNNQESIRQALDIDVSQISIQHQNQNFVQNDDQQMKFQDKKQMLKLDLKGITGHNNQVILKKEQEKIQNLMSYNDEESAITLEDDNKEAILRTKRTPQSQKESIQGSLKNRRTLNTQRQATEDKSALKLKSSFALVGGSSTARQSMGNQGSRLGTLSARSFAGPNRDLSDSKLKDSLNNNTPMIKERAEEEDEDNQNGSVENSEKQKYFKLMKVTKQEWGAQKTLGQQVVEEQLKGVQEERKNLKHRQSFVESSQNYQESSFDSINPDDLIVQTINSRQNAQNGLSNYASLHSQASKFSKFSKLQNILNNQYLYTKSSVYSSLYHNTHHSKQISIAEQADYFEDYSQNTNESAVKENDEGKDDKKEDKVEQSLRKIDKNINTFTTDQFKQLREMVEKIGYHEAALDGGEKFGLEMGMKVKVRSDQQEADAKKESEAEVKILKYQEIKEEEEGADSTHFSSLYQKIILQPTDAANGRSHTIINTGFLSTPSIYIGAENSPADLAQNNYKATVHSDNPEQQANHLIHKLVSPSTLQMFYKKKCKAVSCGFEHCMALIQDEGPLGRHQVYTWGYGGSGCLGHENYSSHHEPHLVKFAYQGEVAYGEAGGYHNAIVTSNGEVYTWGRGDVGQLGVSQSLLKKDQMGLVALSPIKVTGFNQNDSNANDIQIAQVALGDAHSLFLDKNGQVYSCGWYDLGQLGISKQQKETNEAKNIHVHPIQILSGIKQVSCGAVFSLALSQEGKVFAWGSNKNGQMGGLELKPQQNNKEVIASHDAPVSPKSGQSASPSKMNQELFDNDGTLQQINIPQLINIDDNVEISEILAGDCHILARAKSESQKIYVWGQGVLREGHEQHEVVCNQPIILGGGIENEIVYQVELSNDSAGNGVREEQLEELKQQIQIDLDDENAKKHFPKCNSQVPQIESRAIVCNSDEKRAQYRQSKCLGTQRLPSKNAFSQGKDEAIFQYRPSQAFTVEKPDKSLFSQTNDDDLVTIKNTEDYYNFMKKREQEFQSKGTSTGRFEKQVLNLVQRESSHGQSGFSGSIGPTKPNGEPITQLEMGEYSARVFTRQKSADRGTSSDLVLIGDPVQQEGADSLGIVQEYPVAQQHDERPSSERQALNQKDIEQAKQQVAADLGKFPEHPISMKVYNTTGIENGGRTRHNQNTKDFNYMLQDNDIQMVRPAGSQKIPNKREQDEIERIQSQRSISNNEQENHKITHQQQEDKQQVNIEDYTNQEKSLERKWFQSNPINSRSNKDIPSESPDRSRSNVESQYKSVQGAYASSAARSKNNNSSAKKSRTRNPGIKSSGNNKTASKLNISATNTSKLSIKDQSHYQKLNKQFKPRKTKTPSRNTSHNRKYATSNSKSQQSILKFVASPTTRRLLQQHNTADKDLKMSSNKNKPNNIENYMTSPKSALGVINTCRSKDLEDKKEEMVFVNETENSCQQMSQELNTPSITITTVNDAVGKSSAAKELQSTTHAREGLLNVPAFDPNRMRLRHSGTVVEQQRVSTQPQQDFEQIPFEPSLSAQRKGIGNMHQTLLASQRSSQDNSVAIITATKTNQTQIQAITSYVVQTNEINHSDLLKPPPVKAHIYKPKSTTNLSSRTGQGPKHLFQSSSTRLIITEPQDDELAFEMPKIITQRSNGNGTHNRSLAAHNTSQQSSQRGSARPQHSQRSSLHHSNSASHNIVQAPYQKAAQLDEKLKRYSRDSEMRKMNKSSPTHLDSKALTACSQTNPTSKRSKLHVHTSPKQQLLAASSSRAGMPSMTSQAVANAHKSPQPIKNKIPAKRAKENKAL